MKKKFCFLFFLFFMVMPVQAHQVIRGADVPGTDSVITKHEAYIDGVNGSLPSYCVDPGFEDNGGNLGVPNIIELVWEGRGYPYKFALASQYIYEKMAELGYTSKTDASWSVGTTAFRMITRKYLNKPLTVYLRRTNPVSQAAYDAYDAGTKDNPFPNIYDYNNEINIGKKIGLKAIDFAESHYSKSFEDLVTENIIKGVKWEVANFTISPSNTENKTYEIIIDIAPRSTDRVGKVDYNNFKLEISNPTAKLLGIPQVQPYGTNGARITAFLDGSSWNGQDLEATVTTQFCGNESAASQVYFLDSKIPNMQRFVAIREINQCDDAREKRKIKIPPTEKVECSCDNLTGIWTYVKKKDGTPDVTYTWRNGENPPADVSKNYCTDTCPNTVTQKGCVFDEVKREYTYTECVKNGNTESCDPTTDTITFSQSWSEASANSLELANKYNCPSKDQDHVCEKPNANNGNQWYCQNGDTCDEERYKRECGHHCETPNSSNGNKYYCSESSKDKRDGKVCSEEQYNDECLCPSLDPDSEEYKQKCLNCYPTVNIPSNCNDFTNQPNTYLTGTISDINKVSSSCNKDVNQIQSCVLGKQDAAGTSFEATTEMKDNPYCKVWCEEDYKFDLPTARYTKSGGYFTLSTRISSTRNCYVSSASDPLKPIDLDKFKEDLKKLQGDMYSATTEYNRWRAALLSEEQVGTESDSNNDCTSSHREESCGTDADGNEHCSSHTVCDAHCDASDSWRVYSYSWDYTAYNADGTTTTRSDSRKDGGGSCYKCGCSGRDGTSQRSFFRKQYEAAKAQLTKTSTDLENLVNKFNSCSTWENNAKFDPKVSFHYDEDYINKISGEFQAVSKDTTQSSASYCASDINEQYQCSESASTAPVYEDFSFEYCEGQTAEELEQEKKCKQEKKKECEDNCGDKQECKATCDDVARDKCVEEKASRCVTRTVQLSNAKWVRKTKTNSAVYKPVNEFSTTTQYGTIQYRDSLKDGNGFYLSTTLPPHALPIQLKQNAGLFQFKFTFSNIGQSNQSASLGRLIGNTSSVLTKYNSLPESKKCGQSGNVSNTTDGSYVCYYMNDCTDCKIVCKPDCELEPPCPDCPMTCKNCVFDGDGTTYNYRSVSLNNLFPNQRDIGYNWSTKDNIKAKVTQKEINDSGESIYEKPQYSIRLTPSNLKAIREYNDKTGTYVNATMPVGMSSGDDSALYCQNEVINGINYSVKCRSRFLDLVEKGSKYATKFQRVTSSNSSHGGMSDAAWELFTENRNCQDKNCISVNDGIGPSWRLRTK